MRRDVRINRAKPLQRLVVDRGEAFEPHKTYSATEGIKDPSARFTELKAVTIVFDYPLTREADTSVLRSKNIRVQLLSGGNPAKRDAKTEKWGLVDVKCSLDSKYPEQGFCESVRWGVLVVCCAAHVLSVIALVSSTDFSN